MIDLHMHTHCSDGTLSPAQLVSLCVQMGFSAVAISDHDTVDGVKEAQLAAEGHGIQIIPAVELAAGGGREIHILGYFPDLDAGFVQEYLAEQRRKREKRGEEMVRRLQKEGLNIDLLGVRRHGGEKVLGRPHVAAELVALGYAADIANAFDKYLKPGRPGYVPRDNPPAGELVATVRDLGMIPVLAHGWLCGLMERELSQLITYLVSCGMRGLECYHSAYTVEVERFMLRRARDHGLLITGGSDFHGAHKPDILPGTGLENWKNAKDCLNSLIIERFRGDAR